MHLVILIVALIVVPALIGGGILYDMRKQEKVRQQKQCDKKC